MRLNQRPKLNAPATAVTLTIFTVILFVVDQITPLPEEPPEGFIGPPGFGPLWSLEGIGFIGLVLLIAVTIHLWLVLGRR